MHPPPPTGGLPTLATRASPAHPYGGYTRACLTPYAVLHFLGYHPQKYTETPQNGREVPKNTGLYPDRYYFGQLPDKNPELTQS